MDEFWDRIFFSLEFSVLGPMIEIVYTGISARVHKGDQRFRGHVSVKMIPAYALLGFFFPWIYSCVSETPFYLRGLIYAPLTHVLEFCLGALFLKWTGVRHWEYEGKLNFRGHTDLALFPLFFVVSLALEWVYLHIHVVWR